MLLVRLWQYGILKETQGVFRDQIVDVNNPAVHEDLA